MACPFFQINKKKMKMMNLKINFNFGQSPLYFFENIDINLLLIVLVVLLVLFAFYINTSLILKTVFFVFALFCLLFFHNDLYFNIINKMETLVDDNPYIIEVVIGLFVLSIIGIPIIKPTQYFRFNQGRRESYVFTDRNYNIRIPVEERFCRTFDSHLRVDELYRDCLYRPLTYYNTVRRDDYFPMEGDTHHIFYHRGYHVTVYLEPGNII